MFSVISLVANENDELSLVSIQLRAEELLAYIVRSKKKKNNNNNSHASMPLIY